MTILPVLTSCFGRDHIMHSTSIVLRGSLRPLSILTDLYFVLACCVFEGHLYLHCFVLLRTVTPTDRHAESRCFLSRSEVAIATLSQ